MRNNPPNAIRRPDVRSREEFLLPARKKFLLAIKTTHVEQPYQAGKVWKKLSVQERHAPGSS